MKRILFVDNGAPGLDRVIHRFLWSRLSQAFRAATGGSGYRLPNFKDDL